MRWPITPPLFRNSVVNPDKNLLQNLMVGGLSREGVRAERRRVQRIPYKYPPGQQAGAIERVLQQAKGLMERRRRSRGLTAAEQVPGLQPTAPHGGKIRTLSTPHMLSG